MRTMYRNPLSNVYVCTMDKRSGQPLEKQVPPHNKGQSVLSDQDVAASIYTVRYFYVQHQMKWFMKENPQASASRKAKQRKTYRKLWDAEKDS